jgi:hypothetical protein
MTKQEEWHFSVNGLPKDHAISNEISLLGIGHRAKRRACQKEQA